LAQGAAREVLRKGGDSMSDTIKKCTFYFPISLYERLRLEAYQANRKQTAIVIEALKKYFQEKDK